MRKIGELKGKPIVEGNPNEVKNNQIHYKESEGNINLSERKNGELKSVAGATDDFLSYRYFKNGMTTIGEGDLNVIEIFIQFYSMINELDYRPSNLSLPFIVKIKEADPNIFTEKKYQIKFIDIMYDKENLQDFEVLGVMIPKYLNITLVSSAPGFGNIYPEYNRPFFACMKDLFQFIVGDEEAAGVNMIEKELQQFEITREEFLNIGN